MTKKQSYHFNKDYFENYFSSIADFSPKRNKELENWFRSMFDYINRFAPITDGRDKRAIEFGCASGAASSALTQLGWDVHATDVSEYPVGRAKQAYPHIAFSVQDIQKTIAIPRYKYDMAYCFDVLEHLEDPVKAILNMKKIVKKGGYVICSTPNDQANVFDDPSHINVHTPGYWHTLFKEAGFSHIRLRQITILPYLYKFHWRLAIKLPIAVASPNIVSPVFIIAKV